jgi:hypothetical protein
LSPPAQAYEKEIVGIKKIPIISKKPLDKSKNVCYNLITKKERK